jgi:hypothetical protein
MVGKHIMLNKLTTRFKEEDKKMIAEAMRVAPPAGPGKKNRLTMMLWSAVVLGGLVLLFLIHIRLR